HPDRATSHHPSSCSSFRSYNPPLSLFFQCSGHHRQLHPFPTRRSSDLHLERLLTERRRRRGRHPDPDHLDGRPDGDVATARRVGDRKSTRLNSSHQIISYAVCCLIKNTDVTSVVA